MGGPSIIQQCLREGLLDELRINLVPVLLGEGIRQALLRDPTYVPALTAGRKMLA